MGKNGKVENQTACGLFIVIVDRPKKGQKASNVLLSYQAAKDYAARKTQNHPNRKASIYELVPADLMELTSMARTEYELLKVVKLIADADEVHDITTARLIARKALGNSVLDEDDARMETADAH